MMSAASDLVILVTAWTHVLLAPYTKVEESFNLHATHDILMYGTDIEGLHNYDHFVFPGAVPRSFVGSLALAWLSAPILNAGGFGLIETKLDIQILVRLTLATLNAMSLCLIRRSVARRFGRLTGLYFAAVTCSQFHLPFWMGRTLPNMLALTPVNFAYYFILSRAPSSMKPSTRSTHCGIALMTATAVILRAEVLPLLGPIVFQALVCRYTTFVKVLKVGLVSGLISLALTVLVDSFFWQQWPLWPEFSGLYFNVYQGKSADWGVSPAHTYFTSFLPKILLSALPLSLLGAAIDGRVREILFGPLVFVGLISALGHKEWRFVIYAVPMFNVAAARGARWLFPSPINESDRTGLRKSALLGRMCFLSVLAMLAGNCLVTFLHTQASIANYPGGVALSRFNERFSSTDYVHVHISNLAAQTGASLFLHERAPPYPPYLVPPNALHWTYNRTESLDARALTNAAQITHLIAESLDDFDMKRKWSLVDTVSSFDGWRLNLGVLKKGGSIKDLLTVLQMVQTEKLYILERY
ncbi:hypothetical protein GLOTRDRAFT_79634 [Gloeophyllum trabeum ATCC 11539]|uniref:Mannosyltransferase n=1 Tax=Gloeophyllum trabeum (strain ATCC 11539 / FP-39264 / Madison 617) TaxID=670483 RepID=S7RIW0_GLOTA|nr:uncharacterized protein GLOTRDRAFT_79634 [Gloeophyllum trabeum ATCC 11539]EPQ52524.1 hypothetical protein GLOTRDRAFT_79634 [Gloeophyllum trabeum ATCC 11539]